MSCSYCRNPEHNIRNCNSPNLRLIYERLKAAANVSIANISRVNSGYNEVHFIKELNKMKLPELKAACIHWKYFCDPEILTNNNNLPEIRSTLSVTSYMNIAIWLYIYVENQENETFLAHSTNLDHVYKSCWVATRRIYWYNISILNYTQNEAHANFMNRVNEYYVFITEYRNLYQTIRQNNAPAAPREPRKFDIVANVIYDLDSRDVDSECPICYDVLNNETKVRNHCGHSVCVGCFEQYMDTMIPKTSDPCCSVCRCVINKVEVGAENILNVITKYTR